MPSSRSSSCATATACSGWSTLSGERVTVGRSPTAGIALAWDAQVSRSHTSIECLDGVWTVLDDGRSTNGTFVNEERVQGRRTLRHLDVIRVGATRLRFHDPSEAGRTPS